MKNYKAFLAEDDENTTLKLKRKIIDLGQEHHLDKLIDDPNPDIRERIASRGFRSHLDRLVDDPDVYVRAEVAKRGNDEHRDKLLNDKEPIVRRTIARHGNEEHKAKLVVDPSSNVRHYVAKSTTNPDTLVALKHDPARMVREAVASNHHLPIHHLRWMAKHDENFDLRHAASIILAKRESAL